MVFLLAGLVSCADPASPFVDEQVHHLGKLVEILGAHPGDTEAVCADLDRYIVDNEKRLMDARLERKRLIDSMSPKQKDDFIRRSTESTAALRQRLMTQVKTFPEPARIMRLARQVIL